MPDCTASGQSGTGMNKMPLPGVWYRYKGTQSSAAMLRCQNADAGGISLDADDQLRCHDILTSYRYRKYLVTILLRRERVTATMFLLPQLR
jgi:hypothetical protein